MRKFAEARKIDMVPVTRETISAREYLNINKTQPTTIKSATFVAPRIGGKGFGAFVVEYKNPKLVPA